MFVGGGRWWLWEEDGSSESRQCWPEKMIGHNLMINCVKNCLMLNRIKEEL